MPRFSYTLRDRTGQSVSGDLEAPTRKEALRLASLRGQVVRVDEVSPAKPARSAKATAQTADARRAEAPRREALVEGKGRPPKLSRAQRLPFLQAVSDLTASGLSAGESVRLLAHRIQEPTLRHLCRGLWDRLSEGATLSRAMGEYPEVFDGSTLNLIQAGEATGSLREVLGRLIAHLTEQQELRRQVLSALAYPLFVLLMAGGVILFFLFFLLPRLQTLLSALGGKLPLSTQILVSVSDFLIHYGVFVGAAAALGAASAWRWSQTEVGRRTVDAWLLRLPLVGPFLVSRTVLTFAQTLSVLLENGITAADSLRMTERQLANTIHREAFNEAIGRVLEGDSISNSLQRMHCFPALMLDQLAIGENTGNLVPSLKVIAATYQKALSHQLNLFTRVLSTAVLLSVFAFVGFIAFAIVSAVFQLSASFRM
ncbi:type II secretion system F family protein [Nibricoccus sp. IMCC34717]|uniref:type II secretion system F family protein n=1 Tax=Nibricoccus sp. IMCC34717 TaxID=3034021 RepID=UPI00384BFD38